MSLAVDQLLGRLHYDSAAQTATLSAASAHLGPALQHALSDAFGDQGSVLLGEVVVDHSADSDRGVAELVLTGRARLYGYKRPFRVLFRLEHGDIEGFLMLVPLAKEAWKPATGFPSLRDAEDLGIAEWNIDGGVLVIASRAQPLTAPVEVGEREIDLAHQPLRDGLSVHGKITGGLGATVSALRARARQQGIPDALLPAVDTSPDRVEIDADLDGQAVTLHALWEVSGVTLDQLPGATPTGLGFGVRVNLVGGPPLSFWDLDLSVPGEPLPIRLRSQIQPDEPVAVAGRKLRSMPHFSAPLPRPAALTSGVSGLASLIGVDIGVTTGSSVPRVALQHYTLVPGASVVAFAGLWHPTEDRPLSLDLGFAALESVEFSAGRELTAGSVATVELLGHLRFLGLHFDVAVSPGISVSGALAEPGGVPIGQWVEDRVGTDLPLSLDTLRVDEGRLERDLVEGSTKLALELAGQVDLLGNGAVIWRSVGIDIEGDDGGLDLGFRGVLEVGGISFLIQARRDEGEWTLSGSASLGQTASLTGLLDELLHTMGAGLPHGVPEVELSEIGIEYSVKSRALTIDARTTVTLEDVPLVSGNHIVTLALFAGSHPAGGRSAVVDLGWQHEAGDVHFDASAHFAGKRSSFSLTFTAEDGTTVGLSELVDAAGIGDSVPGLGVLADADIFELSRFSAAYDHSDRALALAAARPLGEGSLVLELDLARKRRRFEAAWLPDAETSTIGIRDLFILAGDEDILDDIEGLFSTVGLGSVGKEVEQLLTFRGLSFAYTLDTSARYEVVARSDHSVFDQAFVVVQRGAKAGVVLGVAFKPNTPLSQFPLLHDIEFVRDGLELLETIVSIEPTLFMVSTMSGGHFIPPSFSAEATLPAPTPGSGAKTRSPFGSSWQRLAKGIAIGVKFELGRHDPDGGLARVGSLIDLDDLEARVVLSRDKMALTAWVGKDLHIPIGGGNQFVLVAPYLTLAVGEEGPEADIGGSIDLVIFDHHVHAEGWLSVSAEAAEFHCSFYGVPLPPIPQLPGVHFIATEDHPFSFMGGVQFEPSGLTLGLQAHFYIGADSDKYNGDVEFVLEIIDVIPQPLFIRFDISELDLFAMAEAMTGVQSAIHLASEAVDVAADLSKSDDVKEVAAGVHAIEGIFNHIQAVLSEVEMKEVAFHWADSIVQLPDGSTAVPGIGFRGGLSIFGWDAYALLEFAAGLPPSLTGHFETEAIRLGGVLEITGDGAGIRKPPSHEDDQAAVAAVNTAVSSVAVVKPGEEWFLEPGGPVFHISTRESPFLHASLHGSLFGFVHADITADVTESGFAFELKTGTGEVVDLDLSCSLTTEDDPKFAAHGSLKVHLDGTIGPVIPHLSFTKITLGTGLDASVDLVIDDTSAKLTAHGSFWFQGASLTVPEFTLEVTWHDLEGIARAILAKIAELGEEIFEEVFLPIGKALADAAKAVGDAVKEGAKQVEHLAEEGAKEVAAIADKVADVADHAAEELTKDATELAHEAKETLDGAADAAAAAAAPIVEEVQHLTRQAVEVGMAAVEQINAIGSAVASEVEHLGQETLDVAAHAAAEVQELARQAEQTARQVLDDARHLVIEIGRQAEEAVKALQAALDDVLRDIEHLEREIEHAIEEAARAVEGALEDAARSVAHAFSSWW